MLQILENIMQKTPNALAIAVMSTDGMPVHQVNSTVHTEDTDQLAIEAAQELWVQSSLQFRPLEQAAEQIDQGKIGEFTVVTKQVATVLRTINDEYFIALALKPDGFYGRGRYYLRVNTKYLAEDLF